MVWKLTTWELPLGVRAPHQFETTTTGTRPAIGLALLKAAMQNTSCHEVYFHQSHSLFVYNFKTSLYYSYMFGLVKSTNGVFLIKYEGEPLLLSGGGG